MAVNNYFSCFLRIDAQLSEVDVFPFDDTDLEDTKRAWEEVRSFRAKYGAESYKGGNPILLAKWRVCPHSGPWMFEVPLVGQGRKLVEFYDKKVKGAA